MAFQTKHFAALQAISESLTKLTEPVLLQRSADFFVENFQFDMAVELLALAKRVKKLSTIVVFLSSFRQRLYLHQNIYRSPVKNFTMARILVCLNIGLSLKVGCGKCFSSYFCKENFIVCLAI